MRAVTDEGFVSPFYISLAPVPSSQTGQTMCGGWFCLSPDPPAIPNFGWRGFVMFPIFVGFWTVTAFFGNLHIRAKRENRASGK